MKKLLLILALFVCAGASAQKTANVPARPGVIKRVQPDGDTLQVFLRGDEWSSFMMTVDGWQVSENSKGKICYHKQKTSIPTHRQAHDAAKRSKCEQRWLDKHGVQIFARQSPASVPPRDPSKWAEWQASHAAQAQKEVRRAGVRRAVGTRTIIPRILVIMTNFTDYTLVSSKADVDSMFNAQNWTKDDAKGSLRQYFYDQSNGAYNPQFDIVGPVTLSQGYGYYGAGKEVSLNAGYMVTEACALVDDEVDFTLYDSDNDGYIDLVYILYAGFGENDPPTFITGTNRNNLIWPAYWTVSSAGCGTNRREFDGKTLNAFEYSNELDGYFSTEQQNVIAGIGVACHEFGHALGLPDLYYTGDDKYANHKLLGKWDIMGYGPYNDDMHSPPSFSAYERFFMGWLTPELITEPDNLSLEHIATSNKAYLIAENDQHNLDGVTPDTAIFYLLENRQRSGWDRDIPGNGMMLTRLHYQSSTWTANHVNNDPNDMGVDIIEADGLAPTTDTADGYYGKPGDLFPAGATEYLGIDEHAITEIMMSNGVVSFKYRGGKPIDPTDVCAPIMDQQRTYKTIHNGQLLIHSYGRTYNVFGIQQ